MNWRDREHRIVVEALGRLALVAMLCANFAAAVYVIGQWKVPPFNILLAAGIEITLLIATHQYADARIYNVTRPRKKDPTKPVAAPALAMLFFGALSGAVNYFALELSGAGRAWAVILGASAPVAVAIIAYIVSQEAVTVRRLSEHEAERQRINQEKRETNAQRKAEQAAERERQRTHERRMAELEAAQAVASAADDATDVRTYPCECGASFDSPQAKASHVRWHCPLTAARRGENHRARVAVGEDK